MLSVLVDADASQLVLPSVDANNFITPTTGSIRCFAHILPPSYFAHSKHTQIMILGVQTNSQWLLRSSDAAADLLVAEVRKTGKKGEPRWHSECGLKQVKS